MRDQVLALVRLRFMLFGRTLTKGKRVSLAVQALFYLIFLVISLLATVGLYFFGRDFTDTRSGIPSLFLLFCDMLVMFFLVLWAVGVITEIQRSDVIDLRKMLYLPVSLRMVFFLNFIASLATPALIFSVMPVTGLLVGLKMRAGPQMLFGLPVALAFFFAIAAWTYYLRGLLAILMENKRRRRMILVLLPVAMMVIVQAPNLIFTGRRLAHRLRAPRKTSKQLDELVQQVQAEPEQTREKLAEMQQNDRHESERLDSMLVAANLLVPFGWFPYGIHALRQDDIVAAALCMSGLAALGGLGLGLGYRSTRNFYLGATRRRKVPQAERAAGKKTKRTGRLIELDVPFVDDDTSAFAAAGFISCLRHPSVRLQVVMPLIMSIIMLSALSQMASKTNLGFMRELAPAAMLFWPLLGFSFFIFNIFGLDHEGFRALILLPTPRRKYILGRNLALFPIVAGLCALSVLAGAVLIGFSISTLIIALMQIVQAYVLLCIVGNFVSLYNPYRIGTDAMRAVRVKGFSVLVAMLTMLLIPVLMIPAMLCLTVDPFARWLWGYHGVSLGIVVSTVSLAATISAYRVSLRRAGDRLSEREHLILQKLEKDRE